MAGETYQLASTVGGSGWEADHGTISSTGLFTAPAYIPTEGTVTIQRVDGSGTPLAQETVILEPNPSLPGSAKPRYIRVNVLPEEPGFSTEQTCSVVDGDGSVITAGPLLAIVNSNPGLGLVRGNEPAPQLYPTEDCLVAVDQPTPIGEASPLLGMESSDVAGANSEILVLVAQDQSGRAKPQTCKPRPRWEDHRGKPCTGTSPNPDPGTMITYGPNKDDHVSTGQMEFTTGIEAAWQAIVGSGGSGGFTVGVSYPVRRRWLNYTRYFVQDRYRCVNGEWVFLKTVRCISVNTGQQSSPPWVNLADGYPYNGDPLPGGWSSWVCN
jgi:hypothetical protein